MVLAMIKVSKVCVVLIVVGCFNSGVQAQQNRWPSNWVVLPPGEDNSVFSLDTETVNDDPILKVATDSDAGSLLINVDIPLKKSTTLQWRWNVHDLPADAAEDTDKTHDYYAVAVRFDNDQVLSYMWSAALEPGHVFQCPLPAWRDRETHLVMYSGDTHLGKWFDEERKLLDDYAQYKQGAFPNSIKQIWVIAGSKLLGGSGSMQVGNISIGDSKSERQQIFDVRDLSHFGK